MVRNKEVEIDGVAVMNDEMFAGKVMAIITNDEIGKTLSLAFRDMQITVPFEPLEEYLK
jgi:hypothetical protein